MDNVLIKPVKSGRELLDEIENTQITRGAVIWWLGQSGYAIKTANAMLYIDLYLSERLTEKYKDAANPHIRMTQAPFRGGDVKNADVVLSTHKHTDHMDPQTMPDLLRSSPGALYILPKAHIGYVTGWGLDSTRLVPAVADKPVNIGDVTIIPQPARHENFDYTEADGYPHMSYIIKTEGVTLYHSGDTLPYNGMVQRLAGVDAALLPINGRDARRHSFGTPGNCTMEEALCVAELAGIKLLIPHHYDMFTFNTVDIAEFEVKARELYPELPVCVLRCGEKKLLEF